MASVKEVDQATFQRLLASDPDVQAVIRRVWGDTPVEQRPGDTPKHLEKANEEASQEIARILEAKGVQLPKGTFINPRSASLEGKRGWAGLPVGVKIAIIGGAALATGGALGAFGGAAGAAGGATGGAAAGAAPAVAGTAGAGIAGGTAAGVSGAAAAAGGGGVLSTIGKYAGLAGKMAPLATGITGALKGGREGENSAAADEALFTLKESGQAEGQLMDRQTLALRQKELAAKQQRDSYALARRSALAKNMKDVTVSGVPTGPIAPGAIPKIEFQGGLKPSAYGQEGQNAAGEMHRQAMKKLMDGESFDTLPEIERVAAPKYQKPGWAENLAGGVAMGTSAINNYSAEKEQQTMQEKVLAAIEALSGGGGSTSATAPKVGSTYAKLAGVTPFWKPPTGRMMPLADPNADWSNR